MKHFITFVLVALLASAGMAQQAMELTFTAQYNGQTVPLDSIYIENLTQGGDTTLYEPDTVLILDYVTGIGVRERTEENTFAVSQNYPNPFKEKTEVNLYLPEKDDITITIRDVMGREIANYAGTLNRGSHTFTFYPGNEKYYLLTARGTQTSSTIKMLNAGSDMANGEICKIDYTGGLGNASGFKSQRAKNNFGFTPGDELMFTAFASTAIGNLGSAIEFDTPEINTIYAFDIIGGLRCPGMPTITDIDGNVYNTVLIGEQCWMKENLKTTTYKNGTAIPNVTSNSGWSALTSGAYAWYNNDISWKDRLGALYNWFAVDDANGLCPSGWHVPTDDEWTALTDYIGGTGSPHGNELKSCRQVNSPLGSGCNTSVHPRWNSNSSNWGTDDYGFSGLPSGFRGQNGSFYNLGVIVYLWSSAETSSTGAWIRQLTYIDGIVAVGNGYKRSGFIVRCLKDN